MANPFGRLTGWMMVVLGVVLIGTQLWLSVHHEDRQRQAPRFSTSQKTGLWTSGLSGVPLPGILGGISLVAGFVILGVRARESRK